MLSVSRGRKELRRPVALPVILVLCVSPIGAQSIGLTGQPSATIREAFTQIAGIREVTGNLAIVTDQIERKIVLVDFKGGTVRPIGRQGEGPAEYRFPMRPFPAPGNLSWVADASLARILVIAPDGRITGTLKMPTNKQVGELTELRGTDSQGQLYFETSSFRPESGKFADSVAIVRMSMQGTNAKVLTRIYTGGRVILKLASGPASLARSITPFPHLDTWVALPNGSVALIHSDPYRIELVDSTGARHVGATIPYTPIPVTASDRAAVRDSARHLRGTATMRSGGGGPEGPGFVFGDEAFPKVMPAYVAELVRATPEGGIWIARSHPTAETSLTYDIFDRSGKRTGAARLKPHSTVVGFGESCVYVARQDPTSDLIHLEKYAIK